MRSPAMLWVSAEKAKVKRRQRMPALEVRSVQELVHSSEEGRELQSVPAWALEREWQPMPSIRANRFSSLPRRSCNFICRHRFTSDDNPWRSLSETAITFSYDERYSRLD